MDATIKQQWIEALRSGKYLQAQQRLRKGVLVNEKYVSGFCCLGVLCEIHPQVEYSDSWGGYVYKDSYSGTALPVELRGELGITSDEQDRLIVMNDSLDRSFSEIADYIEENL